MATLKTLQMNEEARRHDAATWAERGRLIVRSVQNLSDTLLSKARRMTMMNILMHLYLCIRLTKLKTTVERAFSEEKVTLQDATSRVAPVRLRLGDGWDAFNALLVTRVKGDQGFRRVALRRYALQDCRRRRGNRYDISWQSFMLPGSQASMSIVRSSNLTSGDEPLHGASCPSCVSASTVTTSEGTRW
ncbi:hypothetical protein PG991_008008 [Apiospora marii]|uniref:Ubiquitin-like domain-containing protein n=2 Tax=Apiospora marii TaxID=335849 RepID=A0ABR1RV46_9PEZI